MNQENNVRRQTTIAASKRPAPTLRRYFGGGSGRRSDIRLKHDILMLARLDNGLGFYRFSYNGSRKAYVGVMAQEVRAVMPEAVVRGSDGYLRVYYKRLGLRMQSWNAWVASGQKKPTTIRH
jgi:endosialidase-like protein